MKFHRKAAGLTQEEMAARIGVSRQAVAKWEKGLSVPDIYNCQSICRLFDVALEDLLEADVRNLYSLSPRGKFSFGFVPIEEGGKVEIPEECLEKLRLSAGDYLLCLCDTDRGIALIPAAQCEQFSAMLMKAKEEALKKNDSRNA